MEITNVMFLMLFFYIHNYNLLVTSAEQVCGLFQKVSRLHEFIENKKICVLLSRGEKILFFSIPRKISLFLILALNMVSLKMLLIVNDA